MPQKHTHAALTAMPWLLGLATAFITSICKAGYIPISLDVSGLRTSMTGEGYLQFKAPHFPGFVIWARNTPACLMCELRL
jgi:hypothetical protein